MSTPSTPKPRVPLRQRRGRVSPPASVRYCRMTAARVKFGTDPVALGHVVGGASGTLELAQAGPPSRWPTSMTYQQLRNAFGTDVGRGVRGPLLRKVTRWSRSRLSRAF
jgi:hypothetical protein